jgi:ABC-type transporter lipoprotein component MlaA
MATAAARGQATEEMALDPFINDPIEPANRVSHLFTEVFYDYGYIPLAKGWRVITPRRLREGIDDFSYNLAAPIRLVSLLLQGRLVDSGEELRYFAYNTTVGKLGLRDAAVARGWTTHNEEMGQAIASWGVGHGFFLFLPLLGPSSARDAVGAVANYFLDPASYMVPGLWTFFKANSLVPRIEEYQTLVAGKADTYLPMREVWAMQREIETTDFAIPGDEWNSTDPELSMAALSMKPKQDDFAAIAKQRTISVSCGKGKLKYSAWVQPGPPAPLLVLIPGIGTHRHSGRNLTVAESAFKRGYSVATLSNPFNPEFINTALTKRYPGNTPSDARDLKVCIDAMHNDLRETYPERISDDARLLGYSLGGIEAAFIMDSMNDEGLIFKRCAVINPPVSPIDSGKRFDTRFDTFRKWPESEQREAVQHAIKKALAMGSGAPRGKGIPFSREEANFLIGVHVRNLVYATITAAEHRGGEVLSTEGDPDGFALLDQWSFVRYLNELALEGADIEVVEKAISMDAVADTLKNNSNIYVITNADDFILSDADFDWLRRTVPAERLTISPAGGHLGNLGHPAFLDSVFEFLK